MFKQSCFDEEQNILEWCKEHVLW